MLATRMLVPGAWLALLLYLVLYLFHSQLSPLVFISFFFPLPKGFRNELPHFVSVACIVKCITQILARGTLQDWVLSGEPPSGSSSLWLPLLWFEVGQQWPGAVAHWQGFHMKAMSKICTGSSLWRSSGRQKEIPYHRYCHLVVQGARVVSLRNFSVP